MKQTPVPFQNFQAQWADIGAIATSAFDRVGSAGNYILGEEVRLFEQSLAQWWGRSFAVGCGNGLDAIEISLRCLGLRPGDRVLTTPLSAFATTLAIVRAGGVPVFVDVDEFGLMDLDQAEKRLQKERIPFCVPVHLYGIPINFEKLRKLQDRFGVRIVEDCAQAIGAKWNSEDVGSVGEMAATSFYPTKNLGCLGDGGAVLTDNEAHAKAAKMARDYGQSSKYVHDSIGLNSRLDEVHAAVLRQAFLPQVNRFTKKRQEIAQRYLAEIRTPGLRLLRPGTEQESACHLFAVLVDNPQDFQNHLKALGIGSARHYPGLIPRQRVMEEVPHECVGDLSRALEFAEHEVSIPIHPYLSDLEVEAVISACNQWKTK